MRFLRAHLVKPTGRVRIMRQGVVVGYSRRAGNLPGPGTERLNRGTKAHWGRQALDGQLTESFGDAAVGSRPDCDVGRRLASDVGLRLAERRAGCCELARRGCGSSLWCAMARGVGLGCAGGEAPDAGVRCLHRVRIEDWWCGAVSSNRKRGKKRRRSAASRAETLWCGCRVAADGSVQHRGTAACEQIIATERVGLGAARPRGGSLLQVDGDDVEVSDFGDEECSCGARTGPLLAGYLRMLEEEASEAELEAWVVDSPVRIAELQAAVEAMENPGTPVGWRCVHGGVQTFTFGFGPPEDLPSIV